MTLSGSIKRNTWNRASTTTLNKVINDDSDSTDSSSLTLVSNTVITGSTFIVALQTFIIFARSISDRTYHQEIPLLSFQFHKAKLDDLTYHCLLHKNMQIHCWTLITIKLLKMVEKGCAKYHWTVKWYDSVWTAIVSWWPCRIPSLHFFFGFP